MSLTLRCVSKRSQENNLAEVGNGYADCQFITDQSMKVPPSPLDLPIPKFGSQREETGGASMLAEEVPPSPFDVPIRKFGSQREETGAASMLAEEVSDEESEHAVSLRISNVPCRASELELIQAIHSVGFEGRLLQVYMPLTFRKGKFGANMGFAFAHFRNMQDANEFTLAFQDFQFEGTNSMKKCFVRPSHLQGSEATRCIEDYIGRSTDWPFNTMV